MDSDFEKTNLDGSNFLRVAKVSVILLLCATVTDFVCVKIGSESLNFLAVYPFGDSYLGS